LSYQTAFPKADKFRLPTFYDVFASISQTEYVNVGLKWSVQESKAAMAYATRLSSGHAPIQQATDDYHIEAFSTAAKPMPEHWTKIRFRQKGTYSGTVGYSQPSDQEPGIFHFWDNRKKDNAKLQVGDFEARNAVVGSLNSNGQITTDMRISTKQDSIFAGTTVGTGNLGSRFEAPEGKGMGMYTRPTGGTVNMNNPRLYVTAGGNIGVGTTSPTAQLHLKAVNDATALRVEGKFSIGGASIVEVDGVVQGQASAGQRFMVAANGNVGVNIREPTEKLHISGNIKVDSGGTAPSAATLFVTNTLQGPQCENKHSLLVRDHFYVTACGQVGVKTPKPQADFHVTGKSKTTFLDVDQDAKIAGTLTVKDIAPLRSIFEADTLKIVKESQFVGRVQTDGDVVIKGNLYVEKEVKMVGGDGGAEMMMKQMLESRMALIEESHESLQDSHAALLESHSNMKKHNEMLKSRVHALESQLTEQ